MNLMDLSTFNGCGLASGVIEPAPNPVALVREFDLAWHANVVSFAALAEAKQGGNTDRIRFFKQLGRNRGTK